jgi:hypothetical protein
VAEVFEDVQVISNPGPTPIQVWFEPWGMPHPLPSGETFRVVGRSPQPGPMEVVNADGSVVVYGWPGSTLRVYNGEALVDDFNIVFPELPPGMSPRGFVEFMFGGPGGPVSQPSQPADEIQPVQTRPWWRFW